MLRQLHVGTCRMTIGTAYWRHMPNLKKTNNAAAQKARLPEQPECFPAVGQRRVAHRRQQQPVGARFGRNGGVGRCLGARRGVVLLRLVPLGSTTRGATRQGAITAAQGVSYQCSWTDKQRPNMCHP